MRLSYEKSRVGIIRGNHAVVVQCGFVAMMSSRCLRVFKCTINNLFQGYFNKLCDKAREDGGVLDEVTGEICMSGLPVTFHSSRWQA